MKCAYCPKLLRTPESRARGYGPVCGRKNGLLPPPQPRDRRPTAPTAPKPRTTPPDVHPDQTTIPIQPELPEET